MTEVSEMPGDPPAAIAANGHDAALLDKARRLIETTTLSQTAIADQLDVSARTLSSWKKREGWVRPAGAPKALVFDAAAIARRLTAPIARAATRRKRMIDRLYRVCGRQIGRIETRVSEEIKDIEKDARALGTLARTLETLMALERDNGAKAERPEPADRERDSANRSAADRAAVDADLAERITRWARGGT